MARRPRSTLKEAALHSAELSAPAHEFGFAGRGALVAAGWVYFYVAHGGFGALVAAGWVYFYVAHGGLCGFVAAK
ncbi:hypothetical protein T492DRAFT_889518 [Pavlovales sp. CCMP2436]|nr:hypothetical protein T492DRAFT_889518 [Pavlovales sp. CCMP2436]